jgi:thiamine biosynthesis lipoprotein
MSKKPKRIAPAIIIGAIFITIIYFLLTVERQQCWPKKRVAVKSGVHEIMGTFVRVMAVAMNEQTAQTCIEEAIRQIELIDNLMSFHNPESEINRVNRDAYRQTVEVSEPVFELLQRSVQYSKLTDGAFDVTVGPLVDLWHRAGQEKVKPTEDEIKTAKAKVGYEKLVLDAEKKTISFTVDGMELDLGGIAKGYGIDLAVRTMQKAGAIGGMVDVGGDIRCFGAPQRGKQKWSVGLQEPKTNAKGLVSQNLILVLEVVDRAITTSGDYRRFALIDGKKYSHIINPYTSNSAEGLSSVTIIAQNATDADALATAVSVMGKEKGLALIETIPETEAILISSAPEFEQMLTSGAAQYIKK